MRFHAPAILPLVCVFAASLGGRAGATILVPMDERDLAAESVAAVVGTVLKIETAAVGRGGALRTYVSIRPEETVFGDLPSGVVVLREIGGRLGERSAWAFGNPEYAVGERSLVFLRRNPDGTLSTTGLGAGKYEVGTGPRGVRIATRRFGEGVTLLDRSGRRLRRRAGGEAVELEPLLARLRETAPSPGRARKAAPILLVPPELRSEGLVREAHAAFTLLGSESRWFEPDSGIPVPIGIDPNGDPVLGAAATRNAVLDSLDAWSSVTDSGLRLADGGAKAPAPFAGCPDESRIVFNDPFDEITDPRNCRGTLALGGFCTSGERKVVNGVTFERIVTGKVTFNNGWSGCPVWTECNLAEIATHEIGHTIGLGHSEDPDATMAGIAHFDGRCASLMPDDVAAVRFVYPEPPSTQTPTPSFTPTAPPTASRTPTRTGARGTPTRTGTRTRTPTPTATVATPSATHTGTPTPSATQTRTATPSRTATTTPTAIPTATPTTTAPSTAWLQSMRRVLGPLSERLGNLRRR